MYNYWWLLYLYLLPSYFLHLYYTCIWLEAIATSTYINPSVTTAASTKTYNSITLTATASKGTNNISKYYFSKDNGATWSEGQASNVYTYTGLSENTTYNIKVKVEDTNFI